MGNVAAGPFCPEKCGLPEFDDRNLDGKTGRRKARLKVLLKVLVRLLKARLKVLLRLLKAGPMVSLGFQLTSAWCNQGPVLPFKASKGPHKDLRRTL